MTIQEQLEEIHRKIIWIGIGMMLALVLLILRAIVK